MFKLISRVITDLEENKHKMAKRYLKRKTSEVKNLERQVEELKNTGKLDPEKLKELDALKESALEQAKINSPNYRYDYGFDENPPVSFDNLKYYFSKKGMGEGILHMIGSCMIGGAVKIDSIQKTTILNKVLLGAAYGSLMFPGILLLDAIADDIASSAYVDNPVYNYYSHYFGALLASPLAPVAAIGVGVLAAKKAIGNIVAKKKAFKMVYYDKYAEDLGKWLETNKPPAPLQISASKQIM